jgi:hypothetical protein
MRSRLLLPAAVRGSNPLPCVTLCKFPPVQPPLLPPDTTPPRLDTAVPENLVGDDSLQQRLLLPAKERGAALVPCRCIASSPSMNQALALARLLHLLAPAASHVFCTHISLRHLLGKLPRTERRLDGRPRPHLDHHCV